MILDYRTLLISLGVSAICLLVTLTGTWLARRRDGFLLTWACGLGFIVPGIFSYTYYTEYPRPLIGAVCTSLMLTGFATIFAAAVQFCRNEPPLRRATAWSTIAIAFTTAPLLGGYDGLGFISLNAWAAFLLFCTAWQYWDARTEAVGPLVGMALLYAMTGVSFVLCGGVLVADGSWVLGHAPDNWAENLNIAVSIGGMTGVGAMSLLVHQARLTEFHRREAQTDSLTGLFNRRALFELHEKQTFTREMAVMVLDIDRFKSINDEYGHAAGDEVIRVLAAELKDAVGISTAARLGGEEFAAVLRTAAPGYAEWLAERIRRNFAERETLSETNSIRATVSVGIAYASQGRQDFESMLSAADGALYVAKRNGRNRVELAPDAVAANAPKARTIR